MRVWLSSKLQLLTIVIFYCYASMYFEAEQFLKMDRCHSRRCSVTQRVKTVSDPEGCFVSSELFIIIMIISIITLQLIDKRSIYLHHTIVQRLQRLSLHQE